MVKRVDQIFQLSLALAKAEFKLKNEGTWLGVFWYLLSPILTFLLLFAIFSDRLGNNIPQYPLYLLLGIIIFNFFQKISDESVNIILANARIIKSINFPRQALIGAVVIKTIYSHLFEIAALVIFLIFFGIPIKFILLYPLILLPLAIFSFGAGLILAALRVYIFDLHNIWGFASKLIWFVTPIFYAIEGQGRLATLNLFNPMFYFITIARDLIIYQTISPIWIIFNAIGFSLIFLISGILIFNKLKNKFAELI